MIGAQATEPERTLTLTYAATLHRGDHEITDLAVLRRCDGALEDDDAPQLQETLVDDDSKLVPLERARATLVFEGERLVVRMDLLAVRALEDSDREVLLLLANQSTSGFWGDRVSFAFGELEKATVVWVAARAELERRRLERVFAKSGVPRVSVDELDALDDLPPDVY